MVTGHFYCTGTGTPPSGSLFLGWRHRSGVWQFLFMTLGMQVMSSRANRRGAPGSSENQRNGPSIDRADRRTARRQSNLRLREILPWMLIAAWYVTVACRQKSFVVAWVIFFERTPYYWHT